MFDRVFEWHKLVGKMDPATAFLIGKIKAELKARGGMGFHGLQRKFRIIDDDGSGTLNPIEFKKAMKEMNFTDITDREFQEVFTFFGKLPLGLDVDLAHLPPCVLQ